MALYLQVFLTTLADYFAYRFNFVLWRFRTMVGLIIKYFLWLAIYETTFTLFNYSRDQMLSYILLSHLISSFALATRTVDIAADILNGDIMNILLKPFSFFGYHLTRDITDKLINVIFSFCEVVFLYLILKPQIIIASEPSVLFLVVLFVIMGSIIAFNINVLISFIAFWSPEVWAPRFIFFIIVTFFSGGFFPLDMLPPALYNLILLTPFPYFYFIPAKLYLGFHPMEVGAYMALTIFWVVFTSYIVKKVWSKGLCSYSFFGR